MSQVTWIGKLAAVAQVDTFTPANVESSDDFILTATGPDGSTSVLTFTATGGTVANVTAGLVALVNASTHRLWTGITAADNTTNLTLTADSAGTPFSVAATTTDHGGSNTQTLTRAATTANVGSEDVSLAGNYLANAMFVASDTLTLDGLADENITYGLNQSAITLTKLDAKKSFTLYAGDPDQRYYLRVSATTANIGESVPGTSNIGSQFFALDTGTNAATVNVYGSANQGLNGLPPVLLKGAHASNVLNLFDGISGLGVMVPGETFNFPVINCFGGTHTIGASGTAPTTLNQDDGDLTSYAGSLTGTTIKQDGGVLTLVGSASAATVWAGGKLIAKGTGKITTLEIPDGGVVDCTDIPATAAAPVTFAGDIILHAGATLNLDNGIPGSIVCDNPVQLYHCSPADVTLKLPRHMKLTLAKI